MAKKIPNRQKKLKMISRYVALGGRPSMRKKQPRASQRSHNCCWWHRRCVPDTPHDQWSISKACNRRSSFLSSDWVSFENSTHPEFSWLFCVQQECMLGENINSALRSNRCAVYLLGLVVHIPHKSDLAELCRGGRCSPDRFNHVDVPEYAFLLVGNIFRVFSLMRFLL